MRMIGAAISAILSAVIIGFFLMQPTHTERIEMSQCLLPENINQLQKILIKLRNNIHWTIVAPKDYNGKGALNGLYAYRQFDEVEGSDYTKSIDGLFYYKNSNKNKYKLGRYKVAIINSEKISKQLEPIYDCYKITSVDCGKKTVDLIVVNCPKAGMGSFLLLSNKEITLLVREESDNYKRIFTKYALQVIINEIAEASK